MPCTRHVSNIQETTYITTRSVPSFLPQSDKTFLQLTFQYYFLEAVIPYQTTTPTCTSPQHLLLSQRWEAQCLFQLHQPNTLARSRSPFLLVHRLSPLIQLYLLSSLDPPSRKMPLMMPLLEIPTSTTFAPSTCTSTPATSKNVVLKSPSPLMAARGAPQSAQLPMTASLSRSAPHLEKSKKLSCS